MGYRGVRGAWWEGRGVQEGARGLTNMGMHRQLTKDSLAVRNEERIFTTLVCLVRMWDDLGSNLQSETACIHQSAAASKSVSVGQM